MSYNFNINEMTGDFVEMCHKNDEDVIDYYKEIQNFRAYGSIKDFRKVIDTNFNNFCYNNSLIHKMNMDMLDDNQLLVYKIIGHAFTNEPSFKDLPSSFTNKIILNYYITHLNDKMDNVKLEDLKMLCNYWYDNIPSRYLKKQKIIDDISEIKMPDIQPNLELIKHTTDFLRIGNSLLFNVDGFPKSQLNLLLYGIAVYYTIIKYKAGDFKTFKDMINYMKSFIQINTYSKCLDVLEYKECANMEPESKPNPEDSFYNLITYLTFKNKEYNYRYSCAEKYFKDNDEKQNENKTKFIRKPDGESYIFTEYKNVDELVKVWDELEELYSSEGLTDKLIIKWFDSQLLTRSTCLIGCMLIMIKENKYIEFIKDEMPDWKSIGLGTIEGTYKVKNDSIPDLGLDKNIKLVDVLYSLFNFIINIKLNLN